MSKLSLPLLGKGRNALSSSRVSLLGATWRAPFRTLSTDGNGDGETSPGNGLVFGKLTGIARNAVKSDVIHFFEGAGDNRSDNSLETADEFERRLFGSIDNVPSTDSFYKKLDKLEKARGRSNMGSKMGNGGNSQFNEGGMDGGYSTLADGMDAKLKKAASTFVYDDEIGGDYQYRPDVTFKDGMTYTPRDLDLTKPGIQRAPSQRPEFETTTAEVLKKADFRNVKLLTHFITEAGIIIKRSQTKISAKAQRKVAREIKTARAFGLMPYTTMGRKRFVFGRTAKVDDEQELETYSSNNMPEAVEAF